jgi:acetyltransferase
LGTENFDKIFNPRGIAVVGASDRETSVGAKLLHNLIGVGFRGVVYPVNLFRPTVHGIVAYPNVRKIPGKVDLAIVATPAHTVPQIVKECGETGVSGIIIISAGFREAGEEGKNLEEQILKYKKQYNLRIIGPNSLGVINPRIKLNATIANKSIKPGEIAFISQSAALCTSVLDWATEANMGFSAIVSVGSMVDVDFGDLIDYFGSDIHTKSIVLYIECIKDARKFLSAARGFARAKPIVVVKAGRFPESAKATFCHTGALCGEDAVYDAAFKRTGVVRVEAIHDLFNCAQALAKQPNPEGSNLTIITNAGGPGIMATDFLIAKGGKLSDLDSETVQALRRGLPPYCSSENPIDILEEATVDRFRKTMELCFNDQNGDGFLIIYTPQGAADPIKTAETIVDLSGKTKKTLLTCLMGEDGCRTARRILLKNNIPSFTTPEQAISTFMSMYGYTKNLELLYETPEELAIDVKVPKFLKDALRRAFKEEHFVLNPLESLQFLQAYKIPTIRTLLAKTPEEAVAVAAQVGYPIAMKVLSPQIIHKSKADGVLLNVWSPTQMKELYQELAERTRRAKAEFQGVIIQPMIQKSKCEVIIGSKKDPHFGAVILFGMGGVAAELLRDINIGFPPLNQILAKRLMEGVTAYKRLNCDNATNAKLEEILVKFSQLVIDFPEIKELDINPILVSEDQAVAVDSRIVIDTEKILKKAQPHDHLVIASYPKKYETSFELRGGRSVLLRPIRPEDETLVRELFQSLSKESMRYRFFQVIKEMSHEMLTRYCNVDYDREIAIVAEENRGKRRIIGVVRLVVEPGQKFGEIAVVVGDQWQGRGLGSKLLDCILRIGKDMGLNSVGGDVLTRNNKIIHICTEKGFKMEPIDEDTLKLTLDLNNW